MFKKIFVFALSITLVLSSFSGCSKSKEAIWDKAALNEKDAYIQVVDEMYAYDIALNLSENQDFQSSSLGSRTAGSDAEHAAADYIATEMKAIGLKDVEKIGVDVDKWQFKDATLTINGSNKVIKPHSYATASTPKSGINAEIVYVGDGTMYDYEGLDVTGKIVLIDIDQRSNWWITYPMLEAELQGAAAIMSANVGGFAQLNKDALNCQDICGPTSIPTVSISVNDSDFIKAELDKGKVTANLTVDNIVEPGGTSYNIIGKIPGNGESDQLIAIGSHYDTYFKGFQDNSCAVALNLAMAKAMIDSGYTPDNDIVFIIHGSEEWGSIDTPFDWTIGAWRMINEVHPEWVGKLKSFINFELPAYEFADYTSVYSAPELYSSISRFVNESPFAVVPENCFPEGVKTEGYQTYTYSDDFSYYVAGVPSTVNGFLLQDDMETVFPFYVDRYHSQFDDSSTYDADVMDFNIKFYGSYLIYTDKTPALQLDFTSQYDRLIAALDEDISSKAGGDVEAYKRGLEALKVASGENYSSILAFNESYAKAKNEGADLKELKELRAKAAVMNEETLATFKFAQDSLMGVMYERPIVPHEAPQENISLIGEIIPLLENGDVVTAADEYAWAVNNVLEWYNMYFSPEVTMHTTNYFYPEYNEGNLFWGTDKMFIMADVEEATRLLMDNYEAETPDLARAIEIYTLAEEEQGKILKKLMSEEINSIEQLTEMLATNKN